MLNQMDEGRLSKKYDVKVRCHGNCTIECMYSHLPSMIKLKPEYIILHIGTNDCTSNTSDEVLKELVTLTEYIKYVLPSSSLIISLPTVRTDNMTANQVRKNLNLKLKRLDYMFLDNSNLYASHLGKKGLHFNDHCIRKMASNIISLIKRL